MGKPIRYLIEVYEPGSETDVLMSFSAGQPFQAVSVGDWLVPFPLGDVGDKVKAVRVQHLIWESDDQVSHKLMVFTER
jgi:hypothetical protein